MSFLFREGGRELQRVELDDADKVVGASPGRRSWWAQKKLRVAGVCGGWVYDNVTWGELWGGVAESTCLGCANDRQDRRKSGGRPAAHRGNEIEEVCLKNFPNFPG